MKNSRLILKPGREKAVLRRHPWIFSGAVSRVEGGPASGGCVRVEAADGSFLAWGAYSAASQIVARLWSFEESRPLDETLVQQLVARAVSVRRRHFPETEALRLINAESDGLPGVVCDRYAQQLVLQLTSAGAVALRDALVESLVDATGCDAVHERSDGDVMALEGLESRNGTLRGPPPAIPLTITESALRFEVNVAEGQKTGFFLDQRDNRALVRHYSHNAEVLDCFCYTGGFTLNALAGGAHRVTAIDASEQALALAHTQLGLNGMNAERVDFIEDDVFKRLRKLRDQARTFDLIVLDPPKFAPTAAMAERAARGYKDINLLALKLLKPGGLLFTFSCSGGISRDLFQKIVAGAASDAGLPAQIVKGLGPSADHPVALAFPEGDYLKGLLVQIPG